MNFELPDNLIATSPSSARDGDRLLIFEKNKCLHESFLNITNYLRNDDVIIFNNSMVFKARLEIFHCSKEIESELLLVNQESQNIWTAMLKKAKKFKINEYFILKNSIRAKVVDILEDGLRKIEFDNPFSAFDANEIGQIPLPPYILEERKKRGEGLYLADDEMRYQTLFAKYYGSVAAPTASLRFSEAILRELKKRGIQFEEITLHVGPGTFKPIDVDPDKFIIHKEYMTVSQDVMDRILEAKQEGRRIIAAGTTVCRALESAIDRKFDGWTDIFIKPGYEFQVIDGLLTNFHLPQSTLLLLVQSFIGIEETKYIYFEALTEKYRFYSYGDGMLLFK